MSTFEEIAEEYRRMRNGESTQASQAQQPAAPTAASNDEKYNEVAQEYQRLQNGGERKVNPPKAPATQKPAEPATPTVAPQTENPGKISRYIQSPALQAAKTRAYEDNWKQAEAAGMTRADWFRAVTSYAKSLESQHSKNEKEILNLEHGVEQQRTDLSFLSEADVPAAADSLRADEEKLEALRKAYSAEEEELKTAKEFADYTRQYDPNRGKSKAQRAVDALTAGVEHGMRRLGTAGWSVLDWAFGQNSAPYVSTKAAHAMFADMVNNFADADLIDAEAIRNEQNPITTLHEQAVKNTKDFDDYVAKLVFDDKVAEQIEKHTSGLVQNLPFVLLNAISLGGASAAEAGAAMTTKTLQGIAAANTGGTAVAILGNTLGQYTATLAKNPAAQYSFVMSFGESLDEAKEEGADDIKATVYALLNAATNTVIEFGGGFETAPVNTKRLTDTIFEEVGEEELQRLFELGLKSTYKDVKWADAEDPEAILNPQAIAQTAADTFVGTLLQAPVQHLAQRVAIGTEQKDMQRCLTILESVKTDAEQIPALEQINRRPKLRKAFEALYNTSPEAVLEELKAEQEKGDESAVSALPAQMPQEAAGAPIAAESTETATHGAETRTEAPALLNTETQHTAQQTAQKGAVLDALRMGGQGNRAERVPAQLNIDNTANPTYNNAENTMGGEADVEGRSFGEAGRVPGESVEGPGATRGQSGGNSGLAGVVLLSQKNADKIRGRIRPNGSSGVVVELHDGSADMAAFSLALNAAKAADQKNGWAVDAKTVGQLQGDGAKVYITDDGSAGFAVNADGDITAVFSNKSAGAPRGTTDSMIPQAIAAGGNKLDCFGPVLAKIYAQHGFVPVARVQFDAEYAKENIPGWTPEKGEPPIYFMMHNGDSVDAVVDNFGKYHIPTAEELDALPIMDYDDAYAYRDELLAKQIGKGGGRQFAAATAKEERTSNALTSAETQGERRIATLPAEARNDGTGDEAADGASVQKRSKTESHTLQHMADVTGGQQEELYYTPKSERESLTNALNRVNSGYNGEMQRLADKEMWTGEDIDTALTIQGLLQMDGVRTRDFSAAQAWSRVVQNRGTLSGQALQAFSKWTRSGVAAAAQSMNALLEAKNLSEEDRTRITNDIYNFAQEYDSIEDGNLNGIRDLIKRQAKYRNTWTLDKKNFDRMLTEMEDFDWLKEYALRQMMNISADYTEEADLGQKLKTWQVNAQLSRLGTFFRNIGGNAVFGVQDTLSQDFFGVALDALVSKATGKRTLSMDKGWLSSEARKGARQGLVRSILEVAGDVDMGEGAGKYENSSNRTFKMTGNAFDKMMSRWEQMLGYSLTSSDRFFRGGIETEQQRGLERFENLTEEERAALAQNMADYRLFQNHGLAYGLAKGAHDLMNLVGIGGQVNNPAQGRQGGFGAGDMVMPYPGVPANLWAKALEYSPANIVKGGVELFTLLNDVKNGKDWNITRQQNAVMDVARGLHGTALVALLAALFRAGIFHNADDEDDPDAKALAKAEGRQGVQINLSAGLRWMRGGNRDWQDGDKLMKIDWLEPMNAFMAIASLAADDLNDPYKYMGDTLEGSLQALLDMPVMESIANVIDTYNYSRANSTGGKLADAGTGLLADAATGMLPAPVSQIARAMDPYYRDTVGTSAGETALNRVLNAIPVLRQTLPEKLDNFGRPMEQAESAYDRWMNSFVRPGQISDYKGQKLYEALDNFAKITGDKSVYPDRKAPNSFRMGDYQVQMTDEQKHLYQKTYGKTVETCYSNILLGEDYKDLSNAEKSWLLDQVKDYSAYKAKQAVMKSRGRSYADKSMEKTEAVAKTGVDVADYLLGKKNADRDGNGSLSQEEVYKWLLGKNYTEKQKSAIWETRGWKTDWASYLASLGK